MDTGSIVRSSGIQILSETRSHSLFSRDCLVALVERTPDGYGSIGSTGIMTEQGLAYLVWRGEHAFLAGKGSIRRATDDEVAAIRRFSDDLKSILAPPAGTAI